MKLEHAIEQQVVAIARRAGVESLKFQPIGSGGWPDRVFLVPGGRPLFIEFKRPGEELRPLQCARRDQLMRLGYHVKIADSIESGREAVTRALAAAPIPDGRRFKDGS